MLLISGATLIDGVTDRPRERMTICVEDGRIRAIGRRDDFSTHHTGQILDISGRFVIPGLMNANVHLMDPRVENLVRNESCYEDIVLEAAQVALKSGLTTVFDTWGPRKPLMAARDKINAGDAPGSRIFCAGNIIGMDGPFSADSTANATGVISATIAERVNALYVENVGPSLSWMTPSQIAQEVREYIGKGIDFIKYASSEHRWLDPTAFLVFSPEAQVAMVEEAHGAGLTAQAHATAVEALRVAVEAGCDLIQHCNITGPVPIPEDTLHSMVERGTGAVVFPFTQKRLDWIMRSCIDRGYFVTSDLNCRNLIRVGARLMLANDACLFAPEMATDPVWGKFWCAPGEDNLNEFSQGHFTWLKAMEEKGCPPMTMLRASTRNIAIAYQKDNDLGTIEPGKVADMLILDKNPLIAAENYRTIYAVIKDGAVVNRDALPVKSVQTRPCAEPTPEVEAYRAHRKRGNFPHCC